MINLTQNQAHRHTDADTACWFEAVYAPSCCRVLKYYLWLIAGSKAASVWSSVRCAVRRLDWNHLISGWCDIMILSETTRCQVVQVSSYLFQRRKGVDGMILTGASFRFSISVDFTNFLDILFVLVVDFCCSSSEATPWVMLELTFWPRLFKSTHLCSRCIAGCKMMEEEELNTFRVTSYSYIEFSLPQLFDTFVYHICHAIYLVYRNRNKHMYYSFFFFFLVGESFEILGSSSIWKQLPCSLFIYLFSFSVIQILCVMNCFANIFCLSFFFSLYYCSLRMQHFILGQEWNNPGWLQTCHVCSGEVCGVDVLVF